MAFISHTQPIATPMVTQASPPMTTADYMAKARILRSETIFLPILRGLQSGLSRLAKAFFAPSMVQDKKPTDLDLIMQARAYRDQTLFAPLVNGVIALISMAMNGWKRSAMRNQLDALDDHQLRDIGLRRDEIPGLVAQAFRGSFPSANMSSAPAELYFLAPAQPTPTSARHDRLAA